MSVPPLLARPSLHLALSVLLAATAVAALGPIPATIPALYLAAVTPTLALTDLREHRLPNRITYSGIVVGLVAAAVSWLVGGALPLVPLAASAGFTLFLFTLSLAGGFGMGDVKLAAALGLASPSPTVALLSPLLAFLAGGVAAAIVLIARGPSARRARIAFGPFLLGGYFAALAAVVVSTVAVTRIGR